MAVFIRKLEANILPHITTGVNTLDINLEIGTGGYFKIHGFEGLLQRYSESYVTRLIDRGSRNKYGLIRNNEEEFKTLEVSY